MIAVFPALSDPEPGRLIEEQAAARGVAVEIEKVTDVAAILGYGVIPLDV